MFLLFPSANGIGTPLLSPVAERGVLARWTSAPQRRCYRHLIWQMRDSKTTEYDAEFDLMAMGTVAR